MPVAHGEGHVGALEMLQGRQDVENRQGEDAIRVVQGHAVGAAPAPVMAHQGEALEA